MFEVGYSTFSGHPDAIERLIDNPCPMLIDDPPSHYAIGAALLDLTGELDRHFEREEHILLSGKCKTGAAHRAEHDHLMQYFADTVHEYECGSDAQAAKDVECLTIMFAKHVHNCRVCPHAITYRYLCDL